MPGGTTPPPGREATVNVAVRGADETAAGSVGVAGASAVAEDGDRPVDAVVAVGDDAIRSTVTDPPAAPVLPVTAEGGRHLVARAELDGALASLVAGDGGREAHPVVGVHRDGRVVARAVRDVALVTAAPASISEYGLAAGGTDLGSIRADGVVVATPMGSDGYAAAAGGAVLEAGTGLAVAPIAPFSTSPDRHVVDAAAGLGLSVEREGAVALFADGVRRATVDAGTDLRVERVGSLDVLTPGRR
ncbi:ATP-NAD kinase [Haloplanus halophilus]|uniref:ATP-NAD kinase n=1 Tax=Haloplanus halophilus TaxID=2949993 RepID=UPI002042410C|nr:ATP-NAD kinase [Haloplanus sp. GDY1]